MIGYKHGLTAALLLASSISAHAQGPGGAGGPMGSGPPSNIDQIKTAHAVLGSLAWVIFFPLGAILMGLLNGSSTWAIHGGVQLFSMMLLTASVGLGIVLAQDTQQLDEYHPIIGLVLFALVWFQALGGFVQHLLYRKQHRRTLVGLIHVWLGRTAITLGMINGGLGLLLSSDASRGEYIAYGVIAAIIWLVFVAVSVRTEVQRTRESHHSEKQKLESQSGF